MKTCRVCGASHNEAVVLSIRSQRRYAFMRYYWQGEPNAKAWETRRARAIILKYSGRAFIETIRIRQGTCNLCVTKPGTLKAASAAAGFVTQSSQRVDSQQTGRPRQYASNAERQQAYRNRKKAK